MGDAFADDSVLPRGGCRDGGAQGNSRRPRASCSFRPTTAFERLAGHGFRHAAGGAAARLELEYRRAHGRALDAEGLPPPARRRESGTRDGPVPDRSRALSELRAAGRRVGVPVGNDGETRLLAMLQGYVANQGDGWTHSLEYLQRHLEQHRTTPAGDAAAGQCPRGLFDADAGVGRAYRRTASRHWRGRHRDAALSPQPLTRADVDGYRQRAADEATHALGLLAANLEQLPAAGSRARPTRCCAQRDQLLQRIEACCSDSAAGPEDPHPRRLPSRPGAADAQ